MTKWAKTKNSNPATAAIKNVKQWCSPQVVGGKTVATGGLHVYSHNARGRCEAL